MWIFRNMAAHRTKFFNGTPYLPCNPQNQFGYSKARHPHGLNSFRCTDLARERVLSDRSNATFGTTLKSFRFPAAKSESHAVLP